MAGRYSKNARPKRPGAYFNFVAREPEPTLINTEGIVVVPFTHSWGPSEQVVELNSFGDFLAIFGQGGTAVGTYTPGYQAVHDAFRGEGLPGYGGAGRVLAFRMVGAAAGKASRAMTNTTPVTAFTLEAIYNGAYGNQISVAVVADAAAPGTHDNFVIFVEDAEVERYRYAEADINDLAAQINGTGAYVGRGSEWVRTSGAITSGVALTQIAVAADLAGGNDGSTLLAADWTALMTAVEPWRFSVFAAQNLTDSSIITSLATWAADATTGLNARGKRFLTVVGGGTTAVPDTVGAAITRSAGINSPDFVNVGGGVYTDEKFGDVHPSQLVSRIAGIIAQRGDRLGLSFARLAGLDVKTGVIESDILKALEGGVITLGRDSFEQAPVRLEKGVTTFTSTNDSNRPLEIYGNPKFVRTMHGVESELTEFTEARVVGRLPVNAGTRDYVRGQMEARLSAREDAGSILPGWSVSISQDPPPTDLDDFIALDYQVQFGRNLEQVLNTVTVG